VSQCHGCWPDRDSTQVLQAENCPVQLRAHSIDEAKVPECELAAVLGGVIMSTSQFVGVCARAAIVYLCVSTIDYNQNELIATNVPAC
jgi:hypothetical protein